MRPELDFLDECLHTLRNLRTGHAPVLQSPVMDIPDAHLNLQHVCAQSFVAALRQRPVSNDVHDALVSMYERILEQLKHMYTEHFRDAQQRWGSARQRALPQIQRLFEVQCQMAACDMQNAILALVDEQLKLFAADANAPHESHRPHSAHAIAILERAFEHAPNITQAEKYKLAHATGLQPRQVTIWFQNRRNRRSHARRTTTLESDFVSPEPELLPSPPPPPRLEAPPPPFIREHSHDLKQEDNGIIKCEETVPTAIPEWSGTASTDSFAFEAPTRPINLSSSPMQLGSTAFSPSAIQAHTPAVVSSVVAPSPPTMATSAQVTPASTAASVPIMPAAPPLSLDQLLDMDNARQCLVFSPLDSLPRLDFDDLRLDVTTIENCLGMPSAPGVSSLHVSPISASATRAAEVALAHSLNAPDELMGRAADEGWSLSEQITPVWNVPAEAHQRLHPDPAVRLDGVMLRRDSFAKLERQAPPPSAPLMTTSHYATSPLSMANAVTGARWNHDAIAPSLLTCDFSRIISSPLVP